MILKQLILLATATSLVGCAASNSTPMHVYQSPLLAADAENPRPVDRTFDPTAPGDWSMESETVVAQSEDSAARERRVAAKQAERKAKRAKERSKKRGGLPSLSITATGGRDAANGSSSAEVGDYAPPLASAYVHKTFAVNGVELPATAQTSIPKLWDACKKQGKTHKETPLPGDAAFFHNAFDANADGRNNDWYTHVGIVESVDDDGTAHLISWRGGKVVKLTVNPKLADDLERNSQLRQPTADDAPFTQYHAGHLFAGYCTVLDGKRDVVVMDTWSPEI